MRNGGMARGEDKLSLIQIRGKCTERYFSIGEMKTAGKLQAEKKSVKGGWGEERSEGKCQLN